MENEEKSEESFAATLTKQIVLSIAGSAGVMVGIYAGGIAVGYLSEWRNKRNATEEVKTEE